LGNIPGIDLDFEKRALELFKFQAKENSFYQSFLEIIKADLSKIDSISQIPFLPIEFFKHHIIKTGDWHEEKVFISSGTTQMNRSSHYVKYEQRYLANAVSGFQQRFGNVVDWIIIAYLPGYTENPSSSLISMINELIKLSNNELSGFVEFDGSKLINKLNEVYPTSKKVMLVGVAFALADFADDFQIDFPDLTILETGGMKGRQRDFGRMELHTSLSRAFKTNKIHSEYGMTELFSQAYTIGEDGLFVGISNLKVIIKDINDPMELRKPGRIGVINIIDLANVDTCAFIATQDLGLSYPDGSFDVIGRLDSADLRGCNLLYFPMG